MHVKFTNTNDHLQLHMRADNATSTSAKFITTRMSRTIFKTSYTPDFLREIITYFSWEKQVKFHSPTSVIFRYFAQHLFQSTQIKITNIPGRYSKNEELRSSSLIDVASIQ